MAFILHDRVKETSTSTGTGTINLAGAVDGFETFVSGIGGGNTTYYCIFLSSGTEFEVGLGTVTSGTPDTLSRDTIITSSNSDLVVNFSAGEKEVFCTLPASKSIFMDPNSNVVATANVNLTGNVSLGDNNYLNLGASNDLQIYHDGTNSNIIDQGTGSLVLKGDAQVQIKGTNDESMGIFDMNGPVELYYNGIKKLETTTSGILTTGTVSVNSAYTLPTADGTSGQVLTTNGAGALTFQTPTVGDITAVTAGDGLTGGGTTGAVTLNVGAGGGIAVAADTVSIDPTGTIGAGTYGSTADNTKIDTITVDAYGRVTAVATGATGDGDITGVTAGTNLNGGGTSGAVTLNLDAAISLTSATFGSGVTISEATDRADLLLITGATSTWAGIQIQNSSLETLTSFMGQGSQFGIYDDQNNEWAILCDENGAVNLYYDGTAKISTTAAGVSINDGYFNFGIYTNEANVARSKSTLQITNGATENLNIPRLQFMQNDDGAAGQRLGEITFWSDEADVPAEQSIIKSALASNTTGGADVSFQTRTVGGVLNTVLWLDESSGIGLNRVVTTISTPGAYFTSSDILYIATTGNRSIDINRLSSDGQLINFSQAGTLEGNISVSGTTVSYNGFTGTHWSRLEDNSRPATLLKGTIIESLDEMMDWYQVEYEFSTLNKDTREYEMIPFKESYLPKEGENIGDIVTYSHKTENKNENGDYIYEDVQATLIKENDSKHTKCKISDTVEAKNVYGVFVAWDDDDDLNEDMLVAQTGSYIIRIHGSQTVSKGDLIQSNGDGTGKVQSDDIIRASTVAKVISTNKIEIYEDNSYTVPCTLHC